MPTSLTIYLLILLLAFLANAAVSLGDQNVIDRCWRRNPKWSASRQRLAMCSVGYAGKMVMNRRSITWYTVTDPSDHPVRPRPGTLRYGATVLRHKTVWITFQRDMSIKLQKPLLVKSFTTIDGRGADVQIAFGSGFLLDRVTDVIIHGLQFHHIQPTTFGPVVAPGGRITQPGGLDGDAIRIVTSSKIWIDHNTLYQCQDGLIDVTRGSTGVTISNNWFRDHDKVMLLGHNDGYIRDRNMKVTVVFNRFGPNCNQRMPRVRHGYAHVVNNLYEGWRDYAIGGSMSPSIKSQANKFIAGPDGNKAVTWSIGSGGGKQTWKSVGDAFLNGAFFGETGNAVAPPRYDPQQSFPVASPYTVRALTKDAGALRCFTKSRC